MRLVGSIQVWLAVTLAVFGKIQTYHPSQYFRPLHLHQGRRHALNPIPHQIIDQKPDSKIPFKKRGQILSSHPPFKKIGPQIFTCSTFQKLSRTCSRSASTHAANTEPHLVTNPGSIVILNYPNHLIARHIPLVKRHSWKHRFHNNDLSHYKHGGDDDADLDEEEDLHRFTGTRSGDDTDAGEAEEENNDNDDDGNRSSKGHGLSSSGSFEKDGQSSSPDDSGSSGSEASKTGGDDVDSDSEAQTGSTGQEAQESGPGANKLDNNDGKGRDTKGGDPGGSGNDDPNPSGVSDSNDGSGDSHYSATRAPSDGPPTITSNAQTNPTSAGASASDSADSTMTASDQIPAVTPVPTSAGNGSTETHHSSKHAFKPNSADSTSDADNNSDGANHDDEESLDQCVIMNKFFEQLDGPNWKNQQGWVNTNPATGLSAIETCCEYFGVTCDPQRRIVSIDLAGNGLVGGIPSTIFDLKSLIRLNLSSNSLVGPLPDKFQELQNLTTILLESTGLRGELPESLQKLQNLVSVHLVNNSFEGNVSFSSATQLNHLYLSRNHFSGPVDLTTNLNIEKICLDDNQFSGSLPDLTLLPNLIILSAARNQFSGPPPNLFQPPSNLSRLDIQSNSIFGPYPDPINSTNLEIFSINGNTFTGSFPDSNAPPNLKKCQIDIVPTKSCPSWKVLSDERSLAKRCQVICGKGEKKYSREGGGEDGHSDYYHDSRGRMYSLAINRIPKFMTTNFLNHMLTFSVLLAQYI